MMDDTDLTDPHGEADALRKENERLRAEIDEATDPDFIWGAMDNVHDCDTTLDDYAAAVSRAQRAALAASRAPDPVVNAGSCQTGDLISREAALSAVKRECNAWDRNGTRAAQQMAGCLAVVIRALPAAPAADAATCLHLTADMAARCPTCNPGLSTTLPDTGTEPQPTIGGAELDALDSIGRIAVGHLREMYRPAYDALGPSGRTSLRNLINSRVAALTSSSDAEPDALAIWNLANSRDPDDPVYVAAITALRAKAEAQPDWQAMAERLGEAMKPCLNFIENTESEFGIALECGNKARAALSDLAKMKGE